MLKKNILGTRQSIMNILKLTDVAVHNGYTYIKVQTSSTLPTTVYDHNNNIYTLHLSTYVLFTPIYLPNCIIINNTD